MRYQDLIDDLLGRPGATPPPGGSGFGRGAVRFQKKIFVMFVRGRLVLKLPAARAREAARGAFGFKKKIFVLSVGGRLVLKLHAARVDELVAADEGVRFDANK